MAESLRHQGNITEQKKARMENVRMCEFACYVCTHVTVRAENEGEGTRRDDLCSGFCAE